MRQCIFNGIKSKTGGTRACIMPTALSSLRWTWLGHQPTFFRSFITRAKFRADSREDSMKLVIGAVHRASDRTAYPLLQSGHSIASALSGLQHEPEHQDMLSATPRSSLNF